MKRKHSRIKTKTLTNSIRISLSSTIIFSNYFAVITQYRSNSYFLCFTGTINTFQSNILVGHAPLTSEQKNLTWCIIYKFCLRPVDQNTYPAYFLSNQSICTIFLLIMLAVNKVLNYHGIVQMVWTRRPIFILYQVCHQYGGFMFKSSRETKKDIVRLCEG